MITDTREFARDLDSWLTREDDRLFDGPVVHDMEQYSDAWWQLRAGRLTASQASKLITPTGKLSSQYKAELGRLIAECIGLQEPERNNIETEWMARGSELEDEARKWLAVAEDIKLGVCGMITDGSHVVGASPDALAMVDGDFIPCEIKCPKPSTHITWLLNGGLPKEHKAQVHFQIALSNAPGGYFMSYHPELEPLIIWVEADDYTEAMHDAIDTFKADYVEAFKRIVAVRKSA